MRLSGLKVMQRMMRSTASGCAPGKRSLSGRERRAGRDSIMVEAKGERAAAMSSGVAVEKRGGGASQNGASVLELRTKLAGRRRKNGLDEAVSELVGRLKRELLSTLRRISHAARSPEADQPDQKQASLRAERLVGGCSGLARSAAAGIRQRWLRTSCPPYPRRGWACFSRVLVASWREVVGAYGASELRDR